jgi:hypothetical protein
MWHHTASTTSPQNDANYICYNASDAPLSNLLLTREGAVWVCAGGATNTNGKGGPFTVSKGTVPLDSMNTYAVSIEAANNGVGEPWPQVQIDAYFKLSLMLTQRLGLRPDDICGHVHWAPGRKIDPATAAAVQGSWRPRSINSSGSWNLDDMRSECRRRAGVTPPDPGPLPPPVGDDMLLVVALDKNGTAWVGNGVTKTRINSEDVFYRYILVFQGRFVNTQQGQVNGWEDVQTVDDFTIASLGIG